MTSLFRVQLDFRGFAFQSYFRSEWTRQIRQTFQNVLRLFARGRAGQSTRLQEKIVGVLIVHIRLALTDFVQRDGPERHRLQSSALKLHMGDHAFPIDWFVKINVGRRRLEDEIAEIEKAIAEQELKREQYIETMKKRFPWRNG